MSSVPLMSMQKLSQEQGDMTESEQISEDDEDPLESVLAKMKYRSQRHSCNDLWPGSIFVGVFSFVFGFALSYVLFLSLDKGSYSALKNEETDAKIGKHILKSISIDNLRNYTRLLSNPNVTKSSNLNEAEILRKHFIDLGFDAVSSILSTSLSLAYYDKGRQNNVVIFTDSEPLILSGIIPNDSNVPQGAVQTEITVKDAVVYANFCTEDDFLFLHNLSIPVAGRIVLARLGKLPPFELIDNVLTKGAKGVLLFEDPQQFKESKYKDQLMTPLQLGMLQLLHGTVDSENSSLRKSVPVLFITPQDAERILRLMSSEIATPKSWIGGIRRSNYPFGPGFSVVDFSLQMTVNLVKVEQAVHSVIAAIRGAKEPDRYVLVGADRNVDRTSKNQESVATLMELARVLIHMKKHEGWKPQRSIVFCSWGMYGDSHLNIDQSLEYLAQMLDARSVAYLNIPPRKNGTAYFDAEGSPLMFSALHQAASLISNPNSSEVLKGLNTVFDSWLHSSPGYDPRIPSIKLTSEKGYHNFFQDPAIPSINFEYKKLENRLSLTPEEEVRYYIAETQMWAVLVSHLADYSLLSMDVELYAQFLNHSFATVTNRYEKILRENQLDLGVVGFYIHNFTKVANEFASKRRNLQKSVNFDVRILNDQLLQLERAFIHHDFGDTHSHAVSRHTIMDPGLSFDNDRTIAFGVLQDLLKDLTSSLFKERCVQKIKNHITFMTHCFENAINVLQDPVKSFVTVN